MMCIINVPISFTVVSPNLEEERRKVVLRSVLGSVFEVSFDVHRKCSSQTLGFYSEKLRGTISVHFKKHFLRICVSF